MLDMSFVELHGPLFLAGTNLGNKLNITLREKLKIQYNESTSMLFIRFNGELAYVPISNVVCMWPMKVAKVTK